MTSSHEAAAPETGSEECDNRTRILNVAEQMFAAKGYHATSVREIVKAASVTSPMLYYYFGSKEELLVTLLEERFDSFHTRMTNYSQDATDSKTFIERWCCAFVDECSESAGALRFIMSMVYGAAPGRARAALFQSMFNMRMEFRSKLQAMHPDLCMRRIDFAREAIFKFLDPYVYPLVDGWTDTIGDDVVPSIATRIHAMLFDDQPIPVETMERNERLLMEQFESASGSNDGDKS